MVYHIRLLNPISKAGLERFDDAQYTISTNHTTPDAILVRSHSMHDIRFHENLKVVARSGAGTNNIPIDKLTQMGVPVLNTPGANANAVKELVIAGMLLACRHIAPALQYVNGLIGDTQALNEAVERHKKQFSGFELPDKTLAVIGLGKIGIQVANIAIKLGMKVIGYDPEMTVTNAWQLSADVRRANSIKEALQIGDFVSIHVPLNESTQNLIHAEQFYWFKSGAILLNFARSELVNPFDLMIAIQRKTIKTYVCDFPHDQLQGLHDVICLPHLGASTQEAEDNCAIMAVEQIKKYLETGEIHYAVNFPSVKLPQPALSGHRLTIANQNIPNMVAQISTVLSQANINIVDMINRSKKDIAYNLLDVNRALNDEVLQQLANIEGVLRVRQMLDFSCVKVGFVS